MGSASPHPKSQLLPQSWRSRHLKLSFGSDIFYFSKQTHVHYPYYVIFKLIHFIRRERYRDWERERRECLHILVHSRYACNNRSWTKLKPRLQNSTHVCRVGGKTQLLGHSPAASHGAYSRKWTGGQGTRM